MAKEVLTETFSSEDDSILIADQLAFRVGVQLSDAGVSANDEGKKIVKAGTPIGGATSALKERQTVLSVVSDASVQGILYRDVDVTSGSNNAVMIVEGVIDALKIDKTTRALITTTIENALPKITFVNGREE